MRLSLPLSSNTGSLLAVVGCARSGKTEELLSIASVCNALGIGFQLFAYARPATLVKKGTLEITDNAGPWTSKAELVRSPIEIDSAVRPASRIVMIDDLHLFDNGILPIFERLIQKRTIIVVAGRDMTYEGEPFTCTGNALALADQVLKLHALCDVCGADASFTVKLENQPESPRCRRCRVLPSLLDKVG